MDSELYITMGLTLLFLEKQKREQRKVEKPALPHSHEKSNILPFISARQGKHSSDQ